MPLSKDINNKKIAKPNSYSCKTKKKKAKLGSHQLIENENIAAPNLNMKSIQIPLLILIEIHGIHNNNW